MRILTFDQSVTASAAIVLQGDGSKFDIIHQEIFKPKGKGIYRMMKIKNWITKTINDINPDMVVREMHNQRQFGAASQLQVVSGHIDSAVYEKGLLDKGQYCMIPPGMWKKFCLGKGNLKKDTAYMIHINQFLRTTPYLNVGSDFQVLDDNIGDAICLGICGAACRNILFDNPAGITRSSKYVGLKKSLDTVFDYGE